MTSELLTHISLILTIIVTFSLLVYYIILAIKNKWISKLTISLNLAIKEAEEKWPKGHGEEKKAFVLESMKAACSNLQIPYSLIHNVLCKLINTIVAHYNIIAKK